jgi:hypothetical protein
MLRSFAFAPTLIVSRVEANTRPICTLLAIPWAILTFGLYRGADWATWIWPWQDTGMTYVFLSSITVAIAAPLLWIAIIEEPAAAAGLALDAVIITAAMTLTFLALAFSQSNEKLFLYAIGVAISAVIGWMIFQSSRELPLRDRAPLPAFVRFAYKGFIIVLIAIGIPLVLQINNTFPWTLPGRTSTIFGAIFLGAGAYFAWGIRRKSWVHGGGQLAGFLAYDLILFSPYWRTLLDRGGMSGSGGYRSFPGQSATAGDDINQPSLIVYTTFITVTAAIAIYFLFLNSETRIWRRLGSRRPIISVPSGATSTDTMAEPDCEIAEASPLEA